LRAPKQPWWKLVGGKLELTPRAELLSGNENPSFLGRRLQHSTFAASAKLLVPATVGTSAGLAVSQSETRSYYCGVRRSAEGLIAFVELQNGPKPATLVTVRLPSGASFIELRLSGAGRVVSFDYAIKAGEWRSLLSGADAYPISVQAAGGGLHFTGALIGIHARIESP
jgi:alpha-N-arabinofuranosidase